VIAAADWTAWTCRVRVAVTDPAALDEARAAVTDLMSGVDAAAGRFREDSELAALDRAGGRWTPISPLLTRLLAVGLRAAELTDGDVDPTVGGPLARLGYDRDLPGVGPGVLVAEAAPGWRAVDLDAGGCRVRVPAGVQLDLGATAKAWTADSAARAIARRTGSGCLVSIGGDIAVAGRPPEGGWRIRVEDVTSHPDEPAAGPATVVTIHDGGLATSSVSARRWKRDGVWLHHLLDPRTGLPAAPAWRTVSVAAGRCLDANIVSTTAIVRGHRVWPWLRRVRLPVRLVAADGAVLTSGGWPEERAA
jgi:thiamine biosynthesis lipoprotein